MSNFKLKNFLANKDKVLGMNKRNLYYIRKYNLAAAKEVADNKLLTKEFLTKANIPTPKTIKVIKDRHELVDFDLNTLPNEFVMKPVSGLEGGGIEIFYNRDKEGNWIRADKSKMSLGNLRQHCSNILNGQYSLGQEPDSILFEERVKTHKAFKYYSYKGSPDIRVIVYNNIPIMSYLRLPTKESDGKANLALGALGAGIDIANGRTISAIQGKYGEIDYIPHSKLSVRGLRIPYWNKILRYAIETQKATNLKFAAVDFLIDRDLGPQVVEINARPGLSIQLANKDGLRWRLRKAQGLKITSTEHGIRLGQELFGGEIENSVKLITGKEILGIYENVTIYNPDDNKKYVETKTKIDTGADSTSIDTTIARKLGFDKIMELVESKDLLKEVDTKNLSKSTDELTEKYKKDYPELQSIVAVKSSHGLSIRPYVNIELKLKDTQFVTSASIFDRGHLKYPIIIGRKSLSNFLVDPSKSSTN